MTSPVTFVSTSPRMGLPLLFAGQAQKEIFVNEALSMTDALLHCAIEGSLGSPPSSANDGASWLVAASPNGDWAGQAGKIACRQGGSWIFIQPIDGMKVLNRSTGQIMRYWGGWKTAATPAAPAGGTVVDNESRAVIGQIITALKVAGVLATS